MWLKTNREPSFINYRSIYKHRQFQAGGDIAILVRNDLSVVDKNFSLFNNGKLEIQAITFIAGGKHIDLINLYNPGGNISELEFNFYFSQLRNENVVIRDFNAHHGNWDPRHPSNVTGNNLVLVLFNHPSLCLLTPSSLPTYCNPRTLDLCFVASHFMPISYTGL